MTEAVRGAHDQGGDRALGPVRRGARRAVRAVRRGAAPVRQLRHAARPLRAELGPLGGELVRIVPEISSRVPGLAEPMRADADTERYRLFEAVVDLLAAMSAARRWCWCSTTSTGPTSRRCCCSATSCARRRRCGCSSSAPTATPTSTAAIRSPTCSPTCGASPASTALDLHGLDGDEVDRLHGRAPPVTTSTAAGLDLAEAVHTETEGNPFFVGEMLRHLAESGRDRPARRPLDQRRRAGRLRHPRGHPRGRRPPALPPVGRGQRRARGRGGDRTEFDLAIVEGAGGPTGDELFDALDEATAVGADPRGARRRSAATRSPTRWSAPRCYEELTTNRRVRMHWRVGEAIEARSGPDLDAHLDELAYHYSEGALAGDPTKAVEFARRAGDQGRRRAGLRGRGRSPRPRPRSAGAVHTSRPRAAM